MIDTPEISITSRIPAAFIRLTIPREVIQAEMGRTIGEWTERVRPLLG